VEDNWESPALGAWGLGWEVWLDGLEITQYTYFQQAGGQLCDPVAVEMTYGLDRIAIALQRVRGFQEVRWNSPPGMVLTAGDVNLSAEQEHSRYYFEVADIERLRQMFDLFEKEAKACLAQNLVLPAHDYVLKCSHTFNVLDSRGAIGVTERQAYFARMREISRFVAEAYLDQRQRAEYPWLKDEAGEEKEEGDKGQAFEELPISSAAFYTTSASPFLLEVGTEELPAGDLDAALEQLRERVPALLQELRLSHGEIRVMGTPRRLVVSVEDLAPRSADIEQTVKGPPAHRAFDSLGLPTPAAEGFARSKGVAVKDLEVREMDGGSYVVALVREPGRPAPTALAESLPGLIASLRFDRPMRWNSSNVFFSRPIRWLLALFGQQVIPFVYAGINSGSTTRGLRFIQPAELPVQTPEEYFSRLKAQGIILDVSERQ
jgi:glycyl-tRNA synthetase